MSRAIAVTLTRRRTDPAAHGRAETILTGVLLVAGASLVVAAFAQAQVVLPFTPVPVTGHLAGFAGAAFLVGWLADRGWDRRVPAALAAFLAGECVIYLAGLAWLANYVGREHVAAAGLWPFLPGDALKIVAATLLLPAGWKLAGRGRGDAR